MFNGIFLFSLQKKIAQRERLGVKSSVDVDDFARDVGGIVGGEEGGEGCNFVGCAEAAERNKFAEFFFIEFSGHVAGDEARGNGIDRDAARTNFLS